jgi:Lipocalin / cytosolic fatty-acid binding protein family
MSTSTTQGVDTITGKYERSAVINYEEYLDALDVNVVKRKALVAAAPTLTICREGERWCFEWSTMLKSWTTWFTLGTSFEEMTVDGREVVSRIQMEGDNKLVVHQRAKKQGERDTKMVLEFAANELVETDTIEGLSIACTQRYKKIN